MLRKRENWDRKDKEKTMKNKSQLKNIKNARIYINNDLTKEEREKQKKIRQRAQQEKANGKTVKMGYNKLIIDGVEWKWNREKEDLEKSGTKN